MTVISVVKPKPEIREDEAYGAVRELIVQGQLAPGSRVIESDLVERLGAEGKAIRAAIERLEQEDLVTKLPGGRARWAVSPLTVEDIRELCEIPAEHAGLAAQRAARMEPNERRKLIDSLSSINNKLRALADEDSPLIKHRVAELVAAFHCTIVDMAGGRRLREICEGLKPQAARYAFAYSAFLFPSISNLLTGHQAIFDAIEKGDPETADYAVHRYFAGGAENYAGVMESVGERGTW
jgi:DNA-binding GntR family transcriptional regulator